MYTDLLLRSDSAGLDEAEDLSRGTIGNAALRSWPGFLRPVKRLDFDAIEGAAEPPYAIPTFSSNTFGPSRRHYDGFWRGVGPVHNVFIVASFMDELASAARQDPVEFRRNLLAHNPRAFAVLNLAVQKAGWGQPMPPGKAGRLTSVRLWKLSFASGGGGRRRERKCEGGTYVAR